MTGPVSSAIVSEGVTRITSLLTGKYSKHSNVQEWIDRLVMAQIEIQSALRESEEFDINNDEPLHKWQEKLKEALCEADETLSNFQAEILHEEPNQTFEGGLSARDQQMKEEGSDDATLVHIASNLREAVTRQVDLEANLAHDHPMQEGSDDATLVHTASNLREAVTSQVDLEANLAHDHPMQEGSDDATLVHPASNLRETVTRQFNLQVNLAHDPFMQEEGSDGATLVHPASNLRETVTRQFYLEANLPPDPSMQEEGSDDATLVHSGSHLGETIPSQVDQEANLAHDQPMQEEGSDDASLVHPASNLLKAVIRRIELKRKLAHYLLMKEERSYFADLVRHDGFFCGYYEFCMTAFRDRFSFHFLAATDPSFAFVRVLKSPKFFVSEYLENDKKVSKLKNTVEKLEKMAGNIGNFIKLLELQKKRKMSRKRKRSGVALRGFFLFISLKSQTYALFCYREDPYLLVIMLFRANCDIPTAITSDIFIGFIM